MAARTNSHIINLCVMVVHLIGSVNGCSSRQDGGVLTADCYRQQLSSIPSDVSDLTTELLLGSNRLSNITYNDMLSRFFNLKMLNVSHNYLTEESFRPDVFADIRTLETLDLQRNRIAGLPSPYIRNAQIKVLKLDYNKIVHITADFLVNMPRLEELTLSHCEIETISRQAFRSIDSASNLKRLDLSHNYLETLSPDLKTDIFTDSLMSLKLNDNFWVCDCHLRWLREEIEKTRAAWYFQGYDIIPMCEEPKALKHKNWFLARSELFGCPPFLTQQQKNITAKPGDTFNISCSVQTFTKPSSVEWLQNDVTIDYMTRIRSDTLYDGTSLLSSITVTDMTERDYGLYKCTVNTTFGSLLQVTEVSAPLVAASQIAPNSGVIIAVVVVVVVVVIAVALLIAFYLKKNLVHRGKLYMDAISEMSHKSETDISMQTRADDVVTAMTPLNMSTDTAYTADTTQPGILKCYDQDEMDSLPADAEYPADDAGCAEYNHYLQSVSTNHSPAYIEPTNHNSIYIPPPLPVTHNHSSNHSPAYIPTSNGGPTFIRTVSPSPQHYPQQGIYGQQRDTSPYDRSSSPAKSNSSSSNSDILSSRIDNNTPSGSPLTFIKEEPDEDVL